MSSIQNFFTSRDNNANASTYVGQLDRLWYDPVTNTIYVSDGSTPGGIAVSGGGGGNGTPSGPNKSVQFNNNGVFGGNVALTFDSANAVLTVTGNIQTNNVAANNAVTGNAVFAANGLFFNGNVIPESVTVPAGYNAMSSGATLVPDGVIVSVGNGQRWTAV
jgi:hypothetical protein